jgi:hypothetical protein
LLKIEIQFLLNNLSLLWPIDARHGVWVAYIKRQLGITTQMSMIKVKVTVAKNRIQFLLNNLCLLWPIDAKLGVWVADIKRILVFATQVSLIKVKVTVAKNRNSVLAW